MGSGGNIYESAVVIDPDRQGGPVGFKVAVLLAT
jgi:hypothetical protein